ncbi:MAG: hypothetical protein AAFW87_10805 [Pseudomonadota bacterium]
MTETTLRRPTLQNDLYIRSEELAGVPAVDATSPEEAEALVHQLIIEEKRRVKPGHLPELVPQDSLSVYETDAQPQRESARESVAQILKAEREAAIEEPVRKRSWLSALRVGLPTLRRPKWRGPNLRLPVPFRKRGSANSGAAPGRRLPIPGWLRNYRPTRKHIALAVLAGLMVYRPLLVPLVILLVFWLVLIAYLTIGPDRWGEILTNAWLRLSASRPELAERIRKRADVFAVKFDKFLDRLPESWADRLALPDFSVKLDGEDDRPDPFDRLAAEAREV